MRVLVPFVFCACVLGLGLSSEVQTPHPTFSDYPVQRIYRGKPAPPILSKDQRTFQTMIRRGATSPVQFAGHYTVPIWGCGSGCSQFAIVDSITGRVYDAPLGVTEFPGLSQEKHTAQFPERVEFQPDSRLMKINGCPNERDCGFYDYLMVEGEGLKLLRKELLPKSQP
jgi:hypothetical protein